MAIAALALAFVMTSQPARTQGSIALLAGSSEHAADADLKRTLRDSDPRLRLVAARVAAAGDHRELLGDIVGALLREQDGETGAELVRAALHLGGERDLELIDRQASRLGAGATRAKLDWLARAKPQPEPAASIAADGQPARPATRTVDVPKGLVASTLQAAGCKATPQTGEAAVLYWPDGRPRQITVAAGVLTASCIKALTALARLSFADMKYPVTKETQTVVVPFHSAFVECDRQPAPNRSTLHEGADGRAVTQPRLRREVEPDYSPAAFQARVEGIVEIELRLSEQGCVEHAVVTRSLPDLDVQAVHAVTQWRFEPARLNGVGIPIQVSAELTFSLK